MIWQHMLLILLFSGISFQSVLGMEEDGTKSLLKDLAKTPLGFKVVHEHVTQKQESGSNYLALDVASSVEQRMLKMDQLLENDQEKDGQTYLLQRTVCTPQALHEWAANLPEEPSRYFKSEENDQTLVCYLIAATSLPTKLKNRYLSGQVQPTVITDKVKSSRRLIFAPDQKHLLAKREPHCDIWDLYDVESGKFVEYFRQLHAKETPRFSADGTYWIMQCADWDYRKRRFLNGYGVLTSDGYTIKTTQQAFNLETHKLVEIPNDQAVVAFSSTRKFAALKIENANKVKLFDIKIQEEMGELILTSDISFSPHDAWCAYSFRNKIGFTNLQNSVTNFCGMLDDLPGAYHDILWAENDSFCVMTKGDESHHKSDLKICDDCKDGDECFFGNVHYPGHCVVYDPATNTPIHIFKGAQLKYPPIISPNSRYCYVVCKESEYKMAGYIYDVKAKEIIKKVKDVRRDKDYQAHFAQDPNYPYCIIHLSSKKVLVFDCEQKQVVPEIDAIEKVTDITWPKEGPHYAVNNYSSLAIKDKKTHELIMNCKGYWPQFSPDGAYCIVDTGRNEKFTLVDLIQKKEVCKFEHRIKQPFFKDGSVYQMKDYSTLCKVAPADPDWSTLTSQQLLCVLYAYQRCKEKNGIDFWLEREQKLHHLFKSLDKDMQRYVAKACNVIEFKKDKEASEEESEESNE